MMKSIKSKLNQKGFSLIELMVVIVIMLILAGIAIPAFMGVVKDSRETKATAEARTVLMLAQLAVNKDPNQKTAILSLDTSFTLAGDTEASDSILDQAAIIDDATERGYYSATADTKNKVTVVYDNTVTGIKVTLPEEP